MNNCAFHKLNDVKRPLIKINFAFKYTLHCSPHLNSIEELFSKLKSGCCSIKIEKPGLPIEEYLNLLLDPENNNYSFECQGYYRNMESWLEKARRHEEFH
ncbi:hypothetical protein H312_03362 [Anncaliia algerae PRA339]|uniref:Tc1-like transposase DDE domain-containing protein n=1 Tax=Anncaliia algerae PRA339 TaxID=1288291 RepID=A0A059EWK3_9MICR|nr:hypothetical protein H312_03362 [Anncaliia algerae PRA339]